MEMMTIGKGSNNEHTFVCAINQCVALQSKHGVKNYTSYREAQEDGWVFFTYFANNKIKTKAICPSCRGRLESSKLIDFN